MHGQQTSRLVDDGFCCAVALSFHRSPEMVVPNAAVHGRRGVQGPAWPDRVVLQHRQQSQNHQGGNNIYYLHILSILCFILTSFNFHKSCASPAFMPEVWMKIPFIVLWRLFLGFVSKILCHRFNSMQQPVKLKMFQNACWENEVFYKQSLILHTNESRLKTNSEHLQIT